MPSINASEGDKVSLWENYFSKFFDIWVEYTQQFKGWPFAYRMNQSQLPRYCGVYACACMYECMYVRVYMCVPTCVSLCYVPVYVCITLSQ
jgi:hypothetical protein